MSLLNNQSQDSQHYIWKQNSTKPKTKWLATNKTFEISNSNRFDFVLMNKLIGVSHALQWFSNFRITNILFNSNSQPKGVNCLNEIMHH